MAFPDAHAMRHDELTARPARTLREAEADPRDWLEGPEAEAARRAVAALEAAPRASRAARLARLVARLAWIGGAGFALGAVLNHWRG